MTELKSLRKKIEREIEFSLIIFQLNSFFLHFLQQQFQVQNLMNVHNSSAAAVASAGGAPGGQTHPVQAAMAAALAAANLPLGGNSGGFTPSTSSGNGSNPILALSHHPGLFPQAATSSSHGHLRPPPHKEQQRADLGWCFTLICLCFELSFLKLLLSFKNNP